MSFTSDTQHYQHLGNPASGRALGEVNVGTTIGGAVNEVDVLLQNAHRNYTQAHRATLFQMGALEADGGLALLWSLDNTGSGSDSAWQEVGRLLLPRATDRPDFTLYYDKSEAEVRLTVVNASTGTTIGSPVATADGTGLGRLQGTLGVSISTALSTAVYVLIEAQALAGEVGSVWLLRLYEDETTT